MIQGYLRSKKAALAGLVLIAAACADEKIASRGYPVVETYDVSDINEQGATFNGEIIDLGEGISDHGFVYGSTTISTYTSDFADRISLGPLETTEKFSALANRNLVKDRIYYVRAYAISKVKNTNVLGQEFMFISKGSTPPRIDNISPKEGTIAEKVIITGSGFSDNTSNNLVRVGDKYSPVLKASSDSLWVTLPPDITVGENSVRVQVGQQTADSPVKFNLSKITIASFEPSMVSFGDTVTIHGTNFPVSPGLAVANFFDKDARFVSVTGTELKVIVPSDVTTAKSIVKVTAGSQAVQTTEEIKLFPPSITALSPLRGTKDTEVTITGNYFNPTPVGNTVTLGEKAVEVIEAEEKSLKVRVPGGLVPGAYFFSVTTVTGAATSTIPFEIVQPVIQDVSPLNGTWRTEVTITGENFGPGMTDNVVTFGAAIATIVKASPTEIKVKVPDDLNVVSSAITVLVKSGDNLSATFATEFRLDPPTITSFTPMEGKGNSIVTIEGTNFSQNINVVKFGNYGATVLSQSSTQLSVRIPNNLEDANVAITVHTVETVTSAAEFHLVSPWRRIADHPGPGRANASAFALNGYGYVGVGDELNKPITTTKKFWKYDPAGNQWSEVKAYNSGLGFGVGSPYQDLASFVIGNNAYVGVGDFAEVDYSGIFRKYDPSSDTWTSVKTHTDRVRATVSFAINGKGYVGTGINSSGQLSSRMWEYDPGGDTWTAMTNMPVPGRYEAAAFVVDSKAYVVGGYPCNCTSASEEIWEFDPASNLWTLKGYTPFSGISDATAFAINGKGFLVGGKVLGELPTSMVRSYDPQSGSWAQLGNFPGGPREGGVAFVIGDKAYFGTGLGPAGNTKDFWEFDPSKL